MSRRQFAVPLVAALLGGAVTAAAMTAADNSAGTGPREQGLLGLSGAAEPLGASEIYDRSAPSVVAIRARGVGPVGSAFESDADTGAPTESISTGSGFVLDDDGHIATSASVVTGVTDIQVTFSDLRTVPALVAGKDEESDLAVLRVDPDGLDLKPLKLSESGAVREGDRAVAIGNPSGFGATAGTGSIAAVRKRLETPDGLAFREMIETDAVIEPATAGGPLIGADGRVIGISSGVTMEAGLGYAVPASVAREVLPKLEERHKLIRPYLGIRGRTVGEGSVATAAAASSGVRVLGVYPGGPAAQAGIQGADTGGGDIIEAIDGRRVSSLADLTAHVDRRRPGDAVRLTVLRDGARGDVTVRLAERPATLPAGP